MAWQGFLLAFSAAISHSIIDLLRKIASKRFSSTQCVCLVALLEGSLSFAFVGGQGTLGEEALSLSLSASRTFLFSSFMSAALRLVSLLLYQTAIELAPLSVTVPYLSFTPAMLLVTAYLLIGEQPSAAGLVGVLIVTAGGYLLAFTSATIREEDGKKRDGAGRAGGSPPAPFHATAATGGAEADEAYSSLEMDSKLLLAPDAARAMARGPVCHEGGGRRVAQLGDSKGSAIMCIVALLWSLTSTFDKMGMAASPSVNAYLAVQRAMTAAPCVLYLLFQDLTAFTLLYDHFALILGLAAAELLTVLLYLWSLKFLFVSYAVAAKRTGILLSVLSGWAFFGEHIRDKILHILIMLVGMLLIVLSPDLRYNSHLRHP